MQREVRNEFTDFPAALSFMPLLSAPEARAELTARLVSRGKGLAAIRSVTEDMNERFQLPRLFLIDTEYQLVMLQAEFEWVSSVVDDIAAGRLSWDADQIRQWADDIQRRTGIVPGMPRPMPGSRPP